MKKSLERLQLDYINVLQRHRFDHTPIEENMQALHELVKAVYVWCHWHEQFLPLVFPHAERGEVFPTLNGLDIIPWSLLARGLLTRPFKADAVA